MSVVVGDSLTGHFVIASMTRDSIEDRLEKDDAKK